MTRDGHVRGVESSRDSVKRSMHVMLMTHVHVCHICVTKVTRGVTGGHAISRRLRVRAESPFGVCCLDPDTVYTTSNLFPNSSISGTRQYLDQKFFWLVSRKCCQFLNTLLHIWVGELPFRGCWTVFQGGGAFFSFWLCVQVLLGSEGPKGATCTSSLAASGTCMTCTALWGLCTNADFKGGFSGRQRR